MPPPLPFPALTRSPLLFTLSARLLHNRSARRLGDLATNKKDYPSFLRAIAGHEATVVPPIMALLEHFDWKRIGIISEKSAVPRGIHDALSIDAQLKGVDLAVEARLEACKVTLSVCSALLTLHPPHYRDASFHKSPHTLRGNCVI